MKISQKRTCGGCRSLNADSDCILGYNNKGELIPWLGIRKTTPQEPCPKPVTYEQQCKAVHRKAPES